ncbi:MAG: hypothetical protein K2M45_08210 [Muribaculaceae bacterium]|nr:hypothetical protein [Muribaculaceae bacterium]
MNEKKIYFNDVQRRVQLIGARKSVIVAGRRTGKTDSIASPFLLRNMQRMPGSGNGIVVPTFKHGLTNTIPGILAAWKRWGYMEGIHWVIGRKAPKHFKDPIIDPKESEHIIRLYNGSVAYILSQDRAFSANSLTLASLLIDEARFIDFEKLKNETLPALGGIKSYFGSRSYYTSQMILSDMPQTQKGSWFLNAREEMDPELIEVIEGSIYELYKTLSKIRELSAKGLPVPDYLKKYRREIDTRLNQLRSQAVFYKEYSSIENLQLLGEDYIRQMKRDLTPLTFQASILCVRIGIAKDGFYSSMREEHKYCAADQSRLDELFFQGAAIAGSQNLINQREAVPASGSAGIKLDSRYDSDCIPTDPICIGMDYNANINWIVAGQPDRANARLNVIKSFYVKYQRKIPELIDDFCYYYRYHQRKEVIFYHDATAIGSNYAVNDIDFARTVSDRFKRNGWRVRQVYIGAPMKHHEKYLLINQGFAGNNNLTPYFNRENNPDLILAIQSAEIERGRNGFRKNKRGEKLKESEENRLELRTDGTDAFDTLYIGCERFPQYASRIVMAGGIL